jgi:hypothetical protein
MTGGGGGAAERAGRRRPCPLDQLLGGVDRVGGLALAVLDHQFDLLAQDAACGVLLFDGQLGPVDVRLAVVGDRARQGWITPILILSCAAAPKHIGISAPRR